MKPLLLSGGFDEDTLPHSDWLDDRRLAAPPKMVLLSVVPDSDALSCFLLKFDQINHIPIGNTVNRIAWHNDGTIYQTTTLRALIAGVPELHGFSNRLHDLFENLLAHLSLPAV